MTTDEVVAYLLEGEGLDFLKESLLWVVQQLMEVEVSELVGAERGERAPEERLTHRNGYRQRSWQTRAGERSGSSCGGRVGATTSSLTRTFASSSTCRKSAVRRSPTRSASSSDWSSATL